MLKQGVISPVIDVTDWCFGIVPVPKANGQMRICVDLTLMNKAVKREIHPMGSVDESLATLGESHVFCFNRLPFSISSAPEIFQRTM